MQAFPTHDGNEGTDPRSRILTGGLTKREWFAGMALQGILANPVLSEAARNAAERDGDIDGVFAYIAAAAIEHGDALVAEFEAEKNGPTPQGEA